MSRDTDLMKKFNCSENDMKALENIVFDIVGEYVEPSALIIHPVKDTYMVCSRVRCPVDMSLPQNDLDKRIKGTKYEGKINLYWPVN